MPYWIMVFNQHALASFSKESLLSAVTTSNFYTLCHQYGLNPGLIQPAMDRLALEMSSGEPMPLFLLRYQDMDQPPIVVTEWNTDAEGGKQLLLDVVKSLTTPYASDQLANTRFIYAVELVESQLYDLGLLLAYELARWVAVRGSGIVLGLDSIWYRLNPYHAFVPLAQDAI